MATDIETAKQLIGAYLAQALGGNSDAKTAVADLTKHVISKNYADAATAATNVTETAHVYVKRACRFKLAAIQAPVNVAANNDDYVTFTVAKRTAGGTAAMLASGNTTAAGMNALVAWAPEELTNTSTAADLELAAGDTVTFKAIKTGNGKALTAATSYLDVTIELEPI